MITNRTKNRVRRVLSTESVELFHAKEDEWSYSHHASIGFFKGRFFAIWSSCFRREDDIGQRVMCAISEDGIHWGVPFVLFDSVPGKGVLKASGLYTNEDRIVAYAGTYQYTEKNVRDGRYIEIGVGHVGTTLLAKYSEDGDNWNEEIDLHIPITPNHGPQRLKNGRLIISGSVLFPYSDNPGGISDWKLSGLPPFPWENMFDDHEGCVRHMALPGAFPGFICEGSYFEMSDGEIRMLLRTEQKCLYISRSYDNGETWSSPEKTEFTNADTKFHCGRLPNGEFYIVGNPDPAGNRCPLIISVSKDGVIFDREYIIDDQYRPMRVNGMHKGGIYGYPHTYIDSEGDIYVICSINKEDIMVYRFPASSLV
jgi:hypothetical protein